MTMDKEPEPKSAMRQQEDSSKGTLSPLYQELDEILYNHWSRVRVRDDNNHPGIQVCIVGTGGIVLYERAIGASQVVEKEALTTNHQANLYSVTKFFTALCILKLVDTGKLRPKDSVLRHLPDKLKTFLNHQNFDATIEDLVAHQAGVPNPLPLSWIHLPEEEPMDESEQLLEILQQNPCMSSGSKPRKYAYSNLGYWMLGFVVTNCMENRSPFDVCCRSLIDFPTLTREFSKDQPMQYGHVPRYSLLALVAPWVCPYKILGQNTRFWLQMKPHLIDGAAYGGSISSSSQVAKWIGRTLLVHESGTRRILSAGAFTRLFTPINEEMTFGLHIRKHRGMPVYHKEGGGAGCHSTIQIRPYCNLAGCLIAGNANQEVNLLLDKLVDAIQEHQSKLSLDKITLDTKWVKTSDGVTLHTKHYRPTQQSPSAILSETDQDTVLLLHGGPGFPDYLEPLAILLIGSGISSSVISFDQRGVGLSTRNPPNFNLSSTVEDIEAIRKYYQLKKIHLLGHSWGCILAQLYVQAYPTFGRSLVLLSPSTAQQGSDWPRCEASVMNYNFNRGGLWNFCKMGVYSVLIHVPLVSHWACQRLCRLVERNYYFDPKTAPCRLLHGVSSEAMIAARQSFVESIDKVIQLPSDLPALCVFGDRDIYGKELEQEYCMEFTAESDILKQCGHLHWVDQPQALASRLSSFYAKHFS